jgi:hypothetical protein
LGEIAPQVFSVKRIKQYRGISANSPNRVAWKAGFGSTTHEKPDLNNLPFATLPPQTSHLNDVN